MRNMSKILAIILRRLTVSYAEVIESMQKGHFCISISSSVDTLGRLNFVLNIKYTAVQCRVPSAFI